MRRTRSTIFDRLLAGMAFLAMTALALFSIMVLMLADVQDASRDTLHLLFLLGGTLIGFGAIFLTWSGWRTARQRMRQMRRALRALERARREAEMAGREKDRLLATITHELRTPMNGVIGMADLLMDTPLSDEQKSYVQAISVSGRTLLSMIDELLEAARLEAGRVSVVRAPFDPVAVTEEVCELLAPRAHGKGIDLACYVDPDISGMRLGDAARIRQVLLNLTGNAIKFTDSGGVLVRVIPGEGDKLRFEVRDTGLGISRKDRKIIFEPFRQAGGSGARGGSGLGLAISRSLVERMGGRLQVESGPGRGSVFHFSLPLPPAEDASGGREDMPDLGGIPVHLVIPASPRRQALQDYVRAFGGRPVPMAPERLFRILAGEERFEGEIVCDAAYAKELRRLASDTETSAMLSRIWLLLKPEERRPLSDLMTAGRLAGFLLSPLRRKTFVVQFVERSLDSRLDHSVHGLRKVLDRQEGADGESRGGPFVLLVEDNDINALLAERMLERIGCRVLRMRNGAEAVTWMEGVASNENTPPSVILMDVHMPGMDGLEAVQRIRTLEARRKMRRTPVLALTASPGEDERARCLTAGMDGFVTKPFDAEELSAAMERVMARRPAVRA